MASSKEGIRIRSYVDEDNLAMTEMERLCVQGDPNGLQYYAVCDDYASRARKYQKYEILVLEDSNCTNKAIGTASLGVKTSQSIIFGHCFNLRLHPNHRGKGMAKRIVQKRKEIATTTYGCTYLYAWISPSNKPSLRLFDPFASITLIINTMDIKKQLQQIQTLLDKKPSSALKHLASHAKKIPSNQAGLAMKNKHGNKLLFPEDISALSMHETCLGTFQLEYNNHNQDNTNKNKMESSSSSSSSKSSSALFALWDMSAYHRWQFMIKGQKEPVENFAIMYGVDISGPQGRDCFLALLHYAIESTLISNHQRMLFVAPEGSDVLQQIKSMQEENPCCQQQTSSSNDVWQVMGPIMLTIASTNDNASEEDKNRFVNRLRPNDIFCDPRDY